VESSGVALDQVLYAEQNVAAAVRDMAGLGDGVNPWRLAIYDDGAVFSAWPSTPDWLIPPEWLDTGGLTRDRNQVFNAVRARLDNGWIGDWHEDAASIAKWGRREKTVTYSNVTQLEAEARAVMYLVDNADPLAGLRIEARAVIERSDHSLWPAALVRAGDVLVLRDWIPGSDITVRVQETEYDGQRLRIVPAGAAMRLELLLAREQYLKRTVVTQIAAGGGSSSGSSGGGGSSSYSQATYWSESGIESTARTIIADEAGDVTSTITLLYSVKASDGSSSGGTVNLAPGTSALIYSDTTVANALTLTCAADGSVTVARSAGALTYDVVIWAVWL